MGSLKSNIGHAQAAAGVGGVIKMVEAMRHGVLPRTLHAEVASEHVDWGSGGVRLLAEARSWEVVEGRPRRAGVSSFGISGTNAHVILEQPPTPTTRVDMTEPRDDAPDGAGLPVLPWLVSAGSPQALTEQARRLHAHVAAASEDPLDVAYALATARAALDHRAVVLGRNRAELLAGLEALGAGSPGADVLRGTRGRGRTAFLFPGQGSQQLAMGRELYERIPVFARALDEVCALLDGGLPRPLLDVLFAPEGTPEAALLDRTEFTQPALFAVEVALCRLLDSWGVRPDFVAGHSIGELVAAHVSGLLTPEDAAALVCARSRLMQALPDGGAMVAVEAGDDEATPLLVPWSGRASVAAVNGPRAIVLSGDDDAVSAVAQALAARGRRTRRLTVSHAFHSARMDGMLAEFHEVAAGLSYRTPHTPLVSNLTGELADATLLTSPDYWTRHVRETVRFADGLHAVARAGATTFVEVGPGGTLSAMVETALDGDRDSPPAALTLSRTAPLTVPLMRRDRPESSTVVQGLGMLHAAGVPVDWRKFFAGSGARGVELPTYAFQRERYWLGPDTGRDPVDGPGAHPTGHPLLGEAVELADGKGTLFIGRVSSRALRQLAERHGPGDGELSAGALVELASHVGEQVGAPTVEHLVLHVPLLLSARQENHLQVTVGAPGTAGPRGRSLTVHARGESAEAPWTLHADGALGPEDEPPPAATPPAGAVSVPLPDQPAGDGYALHPALWDEALRHHPFTAGEGAALLPAEWRGVRIHTPGAVPVRALVTATGEDTVAVRLEDGQGEPVATAASVGYREVSDAELAAASIANADALFRVGWRPLVGAPPEEAVRWAVLGEGDGVADLAGPSSDDGSADPRAVPDAVLVPWPRTAHTGTGAGARTAARRALALVQGWLADERHARSRLVVVTSRGAQTDPTDDVDPVAATARGLLRSAAAEHPDRIVLIDTDTDTDVDAEVDAEVGTDLESAVWRGIPLATLTTAVLCGEPETAARDGRLLVPRLDRFATKTTPAPVPVFHPGGTVLITDGTGALGRLFARHLVERYGVRRLLLVSRRGPQADGAHELRAELAALGAHADLAPCDVGDRAALAGVLAAIPPEHPLTAVVHVPHTPDDGRAETPVDALDPDRLDTALRPEADGARHLHDLTRDLDLTAFVLFSDATGALGDPGRADHAAANAYLDALAGHRTALGLPATAIAWGPWEPRDLTNGTEPDGATAAHRLRHQGYRPLSRRTGTALFDAALSVAAPGGGYVAASLDLLATGARGLLPALLRDLAAEPARGAPATEPAPGTLARRLAGADEDERHRIVLDLVRARAADVLGHGDPGSVEVERPFQELGFDSLTSIDLRNRLRAETGLPLPATLAFDHPSPMALARHLLALTAPAQSPGATTVLDGLAELEAALSAAGPDAVDRGAVTERLRVLLAKVAPPPDGAAAPAPVTGIADASADEVLDFIDRELGREAN
ncbi:type I polyketide synthase [Streptomyces sp. NPDC047315]|uniref:type I polyketide synthase n=1 Tax=Streptomyces sp. NPDC047315 TaxID=3155142 RepID=UPI0033C30ED5